jgi:hypothetical protein
MLLDVVDDPSPVGPVASGSRATTSLISPVRLPRPSNSTERRAWARGGRLRWFGSICAGALEEFAPRRSAGIWPISAWHQQSSSRTGRSQSSPAMGRKADLPQAPLDRPDLTIAAFSCAAAGYQHSEDSSGLGSKLHSSFNEPPGSELECISLLRGAGCEGIGGRRKLGQGFPNPTRRPDNLNGELTDGLNQKDHLMCVEKPLVSLNLSPSFRKTIDVSLKCNLELSNKYFHGVWIGRHVTEQRKRQQAWSTGHKKPDSQCSLS